MAGRIPKDFIDRLLSRLDIVEVIDPRVSLRKAGREFSACCPFHGEKTPSFTVSPSKQFYHCFGCQAHGNAIDFLMDYEHLGFVDAVEELARLAGLEVPRGANSEPDLRNDLVDWVAQADGFFRRQLREHPARRRVVDYLRQRGLSGEIVNVFGMGYAPPGWDNLLKVLTPRGAAHKDLVTAGLAIEQDNGGCHDRFRDRVMFPIRDRRGRTIAFGARALGDANPKYLNSPETPFFHKGRELYGLYEARMSQRQLSRLLVVEGYMDVVALAQHGITYAVATLGTATTVEHLEQLFRTCRDIVFCFDGDRAGRAAAWRALENTLALLQDGRQAGFLFLPEGEDPDSLVRKEGAQAFEQRLARAQPLSTYFFEHLGAEVDMRTPEGKSSLAERARPLLDKLPDSVFRDMMVQRLADIAGIDRMNVEKRLTKAPMPALKSRQGNASLTRTPVRRAIALLLKKPELAGATDNLDRLRGAPIPGLDLLLQLIETIVKLLQSNPHIMYAALWEHYRGTAEERILKRLVQWQPEIPEALFEEEFRGALSRLERDGSVEKQSLDQLIEKGRLEAVSPETKEILRGRRYKDDSGGTEQE